MNDLVLAANSDHLIVDDRSSGRRKRAANSWIPRTKVVIIPRPKLHLSLGFDRESAIASSFSSYSQSAPSGNASMRKSSIGSVNAAFAFGSASSSPSMRVPLSRIFTFYRHAVNASGAFLWPSAGFVPRFARGVKPLGVNPIS
jgi:hypothetical protein